MTYQSQSLNVKSEEDENIEDLATLKMVQEKLLKVEKEYFKQLVDDYSKSENKNETEKLINQKIKKIKTFYVSQLQIINFFLNK